MSKTGCYVGNLAYAYLCRYAKIVQTYYFEPYRRIEMRKYCTAPLLSSLIEVGILNDIDGPIILKKLQSVVVFFQILIKFKVAVHKNL